MDYIPSSDLSVPDDVSQDIVLQNMVKALTGLDGTLVRPMWQRKPPPRPDADTTWAAVGVSETRNGIARRTLVEAADGESASVLAHSTVEALVSIYGPKASGYADLLWDSLQGVSLNVDILADKGLALVSVSDPVRVPERINTVWINRVDLRLTFNRGRRRDYPIKSILRVDGTIHGETVTNPFDTENKAP